ncbi:MAG TPA: molybdenum cofactor guanylyltransferase [Candidatus Cryosericum sp.]|nr:molybdenum cofactor guanylyltransferase [Candidatus Cryosericum sp.]
MTVWTGLVFAGGEGRRMGTDKAALTIGDRTLLQHAVDRVRAAGGEPIVLGPTRGHDEVAGARQIDDRVDGVPQGPLLALQRGLLALASPGRAVALACDLPLVPAALLRHLAQAGEIWDAVVPRSGGELQVLSAAYGRECLPAIDRSIDRGERAVHLFLKEVRHRVLEEDALQPFGGPEIFMNLNTPADLALVRARLASGAP